MCCSVVDGEGGAKVQVHLGGGSVFKCVAVRCSAVQCVAVCCSVLQCIVECCRLVLEVIVKYLKSEVYCHFT